MKVYQNKNIEYSEAYLSELGQEMRIDADYWKPYYLRNEELLRSKNGFPIKTLVPNPQYGISIAMNEEGKGFPIMKMDNIMEVLADDSGLKYANINLKTFKQFQLNKYDVLFNRVNSEDYVGRTGINLLEGNFTFASYLVRINSGIDYTNCYLTLYLNSKYGKTALHRVKRRAVNQANINARELINLYLPIPSEYLQKELKQLIEEAQLQKNASRNLYQEAETLLLNELGLSGWKSRTRKIS
mgnify:CR=1 FL=1